jgi:hypothetical protein
MSREFQKKIFVEKYLIIIAGEEETSVVIENGGLKQKQAHSLTLTDRRRITFRREFYFSGCNSGFVLCSHEPYT